MKFEKKETLSRKDAADRLAKIAAAMAADGAFEFRQGNEKLEFDVPSRVTLEFELEVNGDETELEVELKWTTPAEKAPEGAASEKPATLSRPRARSRPTARSKPAPRKSAKRRGAAR